MALTNSGADTMMRTLLLLAFVSILGTGLTAGTTVRILPTPRQVNVDGMPGASIKRMPLGGEFLLTVNKGEDVSFYQLQWFKNGVAIPGQTGQELRYTYASGDMGGVYTVTMANPCAKVESSPIHVIVERRTFQVNTTVGEPRVIAGVDGTSSFELSDVAPNPVQDRATITFVTREPSLVTIRVHDVTGAVVATLVNDELPAGEHSATIITREYDMSSSLYYVVMSAQGFTDTKPLLIAK